MDDQEGCFGKNLKLIRKCYRYSQERLGEVMGVSRQQIYRYERKNAPPPSGLKLQKLMDLTGIPIDQLMNTPLEKEDICVNNK